MNAKPHRIDFHHHMFPPTYIGDEQIRDELAYVPKLAQWTPQMSLDAMDEGGIATAILCLRSPGTWFGDAEKAARLARECNEYATKLKGDHKGRFGLFATPPLPDIDLALAEIAYAYDVLKTDGVGLFTCYGERWIGDPDFRPVMEELNRRKAVVHIHPQPPYYYRKIIRNVPQSAMEYLFDTTRAITSLLYNGVFTDFPEIRFIFCHAGGALAAVDGRVERAVNYADGVAERLPNGPRHELQKLYFECATSAIPATLGALLDFIPKSQILFGTDSPVVAPAPTIEGLHTKLGLTPKEIMDIERNNALRLFPQFA